MRQLSVDCDDAQIIHARGLGCFDCAFCYFVSVYLSQSTCPSLFHGQRSHAHAHTEYEISAASDNLVYDAGAFCVKSVNKQYTGFFYYLHLAYSNSSAITSPNIVYWFWIVRPEA